MGDILKNDLKRFFLSKLSIILVAVAFALPLLSMLVFKLPAIMLEEEDVFDGLIGTEYFLSSSFSYVSDFGIVLPIFGCVLLSKDRSSGMQRNKLICGKTRTQIYLSQLISCVLYFIAGIIIYASSNLLFGSIFFGGFADNVEFFDVFAFILIGIFKFITLASFITFVGLTTQKNPIGLTIAYMFVFEIIISILSIVFAPDEVEILDSLLGTIEMPISDVIRNSIIYTVVTAGTIVGGIALYQKKDIK